VDRDLSFPLIHPDLVMLDYQVPVNPEILAALKAEPESFLVSFLIVTVRERVEDITVNLQGPLLVNTVSLLGRQLVLEEYPVRYPLIQPESSK
jgi:flagellar assembly factor FliW